MRLVTSAFARRQKPMVIQGSNMIYILHKPIVTALILEKRFLAVGDDHLAAFLFISARLSERRSMSRVLTRRVSCLPEKEAMQKFSLCS